MTIESLLKGADSYAPLAELAAAEPPVDEPAATWIPVLTTVTILAEC